MYYKYIENMLQLRGFKKHEIAEYINNKDENGLETDIIIDEYLIISILNLKFQLIL